MILGNKCDMEEKRVISKEQGEKLAGEHGVSFMETSAKANINVEEAFTKIARDIKRKMDQKVVPAAKEAGGGTVKAVGSPAGPAKAGCC